MACKRALCVFHSNREGHLVAEGLGESNAILASEREAHVISGVDRHRPRVVGSAGIVARSNSRLVFGHQAPHLASEKAPAVVEFGLTPGLAQTETVTVRLRG